MSLATAAAVTYSAAVAAPKDAYAVPDDASAKAHHLKKGGFTNPWPSYRDMAHGDGALEKASNACRSFWQLGTGKPKMGEVAQVPIKLPTTRSTNDTAFRATWLGHACYYVEFPGGLRVLFDPVFSHRCSPVQFMGPARYTKVPCEIKDIQVIDVVIISHNHYDHLDHATIMAVRKHHPNAWFLVPLGNAKWFHDCGIQQVKELDWWEEVTFELTPNSSAESSVHEDPNVHQTTVTPEKIFARIGSLPCQHASNRGVMDRMATLWSSWSVESGGKKLWFGGDTGYRSVPELPADVDDYGEEFSHLPVCPVFKEIGKLRGPFDLGLIPIGAYRPRWVLSPMHANPYDSVNIFLETQCKKALAMHWGTWVLSPEDVLEPPALLKKALAWKGLETEGTFDVLAIGESREF